jgi:hypothetical protein
MALINNKKIKAPVRRLSINQDLNQAYPKYKASAVPLSYPAWCFSLLILTSKETVLIEAMS